MSNAAKIPMPENIFRACEVLQTWRTTLPGETITNLVYDETGTASSGGDAVRAAFWSFDVSDPVSNNAHGHNVKFQHFSTSPGDDGDATNQLENMSALELPDNWIYLSNVYKEARVEACKVEQVLLIDYSCPPLYIAEWWSAEPHEPSRNYAELKDLPGIKFRYVNGMIPHTMTTEANGDLKLAHAVNPNLAYAGTATAPTNIYGQPDQTGRHPIVIRTKSYRRTAPYWRKEGEKPYLPLSSPIAVLYQDTTLKQYHCMRFDYSQIPTDELNPMQLFYNCQVAVADPSIMWPPLKVRSQLKITYYVSFKGNRLMDHGNYYGKIPNTVYAAAGPAYALDQNGQYTADTRLVDADNPTAEDSRYLAQHTKYVLPHFLGEHAASPMHNAISPLLGTAEYEGGHPWLLKEVGAFNVGGGGAIDNWDDAEMADGKDMPNGETQFDDNVTDHPVLIDIRHDAAGNLPYLPTGMTVADLRAYLADADG